MGDDELEDEDRLRVAHTSLGRRPPLTRVLYCCIQPLHYACAFGTSEAVLFALTDAYPEAIRTRDRRARTPLHFALSNAGRKTVPAAVRLLLNLDPSVVNSVESGPLPLRVLADYAQQLRSSDTENRDEKRDSVLRCLEHLLNAEPEPTADFFTALQSLPEWLGERAVVMAVVQNLLNEKISQRFPTAVLLLDFVVCTYEFGRLMVTAVDFSGVVQNSPSHAILTLLPLQWPW
jgi:hypothetical protein